MKSYQNSNNPHPSMDVPKFCLHTIYSYLRRCKKENFKSHENMLLIPP